MGGLGFLRRPGFHLGMALAWAVLIVPTLLFWKSSILWVASMSLYANFIGHWSAYQAARAEEAGQPPGAGKLGAPYDAGDAL